MECRLCDKFSENLWKNEPGTAMSKTINWYIIQATGINMNITNLVPQVLCHECIKMSISVYWFRFRCLQRDTFLQKKYKQEYITPLTRFEDMIEISYDEKLIVPDFAKPDLETQLIREDEDINSENESLTSDEIKEERASTPEKEYFPDVSIENIDQLPMHSTVKKVLISIPGLRVPDNIKECHINPTIYLPSLQMSSVSKTPNLELLPESPTQLMKVNKSDIVHICNTCNGLFPSKKKLALHKKTHFQCKECSVSFPKRRMLNDHMKVHTPAASTQLEEQVFSNRSEDGHIRYLILNRFAHKTQQETQTDEDLLVTPITTDNSIEFKGLMKHLENYSVPVQITYSPNRLSASYAINEEVKVVDNLDITNIVKKVDVHPLDDVIDLIETPNQALIKKRKINSVQNGCLTVDLTTPKKKHSSLSCIK